MMASVGGGGGGNKVEGQAFCMRSVRENVHSYCIEFISGLQCVQFC